MQWLRQFLANYTTFQNPKSEQTHLRDFYTSIYLDDNSVINQVIDDFVEHCITSPMPNDDPYLCDPVLGAFSRLGGNRPGQDTEAYNVTINYCTGSDPASVFASPTVQPEIETAFSEHMRLIGSPDYLNYANPGYRPSRSSILYPVVFFDRLGSNYSVVGCRWTTVVYQRSAFPYNYPR